MKKTFLLLIILFTKKGYAQTTYTFTGNGYWTVSSNWIGNLIPPTTLPGGSTIIIATTPGDSCVLNIAQSISAGAFLTVTSGSNFIISGGILNNVGSIWLDKIIFTFTDSSGTDTTNTFLYSYDNLMRVINVKDSVSADTMHYIDDNTHCYYLNADTLPFKVDWSSNYGQWFQDTSLIYIIYDSVGRRIVDTLYTKHTDIFGYEGMKKVTRRYEYYPDFIYGESFDSIIYEKNGVINPVNIRDTAWLDVRGNVIKNKRYDFFSNELLHLGMYDYDGHPNPMRRLSNAKVYHIFPYDITSPWFFPQPNNMLSSDEYSQSQGQWNSEYTNYMYQSKGYPKQFVRGPSNNAGESNVIFVYRIF